MARALYFRAVSLTAVVCVCASIALAFQPNSDEGPVSIAARIRPEASAASIHYPQATLRIDSSLVLIPVHVTTALGASVTTLSRENFQLFEDTAEQKITCFAKDDAPLSIGLLFDSSGSMHNKIRKSAEAAAAFFKTGNVEDEFFLVEFNDRPKLTVPFTTDSDELYQRIVHARPFGRTSLLDAIHIALAHMKSARNFRKALVIVSDGGDNRSRFTAGEIKNELRESDVQVYAMGIFESDESQKLSREEINGPRLLDELAEDSGGRHYRVNRLDELPTISERIGNELRNQYLLGYYPSDGSRDGRYRRVKLKIDPPADLPPNLRTYYRHGYYAPAQ
jgi:Ca-activated chloride channel family protein